jgi:general stress protein 26
MFYLWDETHQTIFLVAAKSSHKIMNIRKNNRVSVTVDIRDPVNPSENSGVLIRGRAMMIEMELVEETMTLNFLEKYIEFLGKGYPLGSRIAIRVTPDTLSYWRGTRFFRWTKEK